MAQTTRWIFPPIGFVINVALGTIYSWSVFRVPLERLFGWTPFESNLPFTVFLALFAVTMPLAGRAMGSLGPKKTALLGSVLVGLGWILARFAEYVQFKLIYVLLTYGVVAGIGVGLVYGVPIAVTSRWIPERKGFATGITLLGFGISPLITAITATYLIGAVGVLYTFLYLGIVFAILLVALSFLLKFPPAGWQPASKVSSRKIVTYGELSSSQMIRKPTFVGLWLTYVLGTTGGFVAISLAAKYGVEVVGLTTSISALATAIFAVFNGVGRPVFGYLCDRLIPRTVAVISFAIIFLAGITAYLGARTVPLFFVSFALLWFTFGGWLSIAPAATSTFFGLRNSASNYGIVFTAYGVGAIVGPLLASYIQSVTQSYELAFLTTAIFAIVGLAVALLTYRPTK